MEKINTEAILKIIAQHWKKLAIVAIVAIVVSSFFSSPLFIAPKYKSTTIAYPTNLMAFSRESNTEQLLQFLNSESLKNRMAKRFNLYKVYGLDSALNPKDITKFNTYYNSNFSASSTLYESIEITVIDEKPSLAQAMANGMVEEATQLVKESKKEKVQEYLNSISNQIKIKKHDIDSIESKLKYMRITYGLLDFKSQSKIISKRLGKKGFSDEDRLLLKGLKEYGGEYVLLQDALGVETETMKDLKLSYSKNLTDYNSNLSYSTVVSKANLPDKKCAPLRMVIVTLVTLSSLLLAIVFLLFNYKKQN